MLLSLDLEDITLVMQDWGGPIGTNFAFRRPGRIKRLLYIDSMPVFVRLVLKQIDREQID